MIEGDKLKTGGIGSSDDLEQNPIPYFKSPIIFGLDIVKLKLKSHDGINMN